MSCLTSITFKAVLIHKLDSDVSTLYPFARSSLTFKAVAPDSEPFIMQSWKLATNRATWGVNVSRV